MQQAIQPGQQVVSTLVAKPGGEEEEFIRLLGIAHDSERTRRIPTPWRASSVFPGCEECTVSITSGEETRELTLVLGDCSRSPGMLSVVTDRHSKARFKFEHNQVVLKASLPEAQLASVAHSVAALVFRGVNWVGRNGKAHALPAGDKPNPNKPSKKSGGHHRVRRRHPSELTAQHL